MSSSPEIKKLFLHRLKEAVIEACNVKNISPEDIKDLEPVVGGRDKLQLDSLDALEVIMMIEQRFGIRLSGDENSRALFESFDKMTNYILEKAEKDKIDAFIKN
ncbi:MAG: phosphopantetheine-binding protein [Bdellovibrionota bacterium]